MPRRGRPRGAVLLLGALVAALVVAGVVLAVVNGRAAARDAAGAGAVAAVRAHLTEVVAAPSSPTARAQALDGATGEWRARLEAGAVPAASSVVVRADGLESLDGDAARVVAAARLDDAGVQRAWRVEAALVRQDGRWLVADLAEVP
jgi:hypothetical protein